MNNTIIIIGVNGNSFDVLETLADLNATGGSNYRCVGFLDDDPAKKGQTYKGLKVLGGLASAREHSECRFINTIGNEKNFWKKPEILARTALGPDRFLTVVHPTAYVSESARLGKGTVVLQNATVTANVRLGDQVTILPNTVVSHDCAVGDYTCIAGGVSVSGGVTLLEACYLGTGSCLRSRITVGPGSLVGMGSVVLRDVPANTIVVGNPAKYLRPVV